ncbi:hypothetical protein ACHHV8_17150 [Paenibacillus sp. TAB 01]
MMVKERKPFDGLGYVIFIFSLVAICPLAFFFIQILLGNEHPFYG